LIETLRCFHCWKLLDNPGQDNYIGCPECETRLFTGSTAKEVLKGNAVTTAEYPVLLGRMLKIMTQHDELYKGNTELIAGTDARHYPDAIYYHRGDILMQQPVLCEIEVCQTLGEPSTVSKCRLFAQTVMNLSSTFYLIVPAACEGKKPAEIAEDLLKKHMIEPVKIIAL
jgi:DNA-directed RNA polymerase subunit RPC12/RpoP